MSENLIDEIENQKIEDYSEKVDASKNPLQLWNYEDNNVRTLEIDGEMWFVGKDTAEILGYSNTRDALAKHVDDEDKSTVAIHDGSQKRNVTVINESGVYALIFRSKLPNAKKFKRWVTSVVLPSIRKHGAYIQGQETLSKKNLETVYQKMDELMKLQTGNSVSKEKVARMEHKTRLKEIELEMKKTEIQAELQKQQLEMEMKKGSWNWLLKK